MGLTHIVEELQGNPVGPSEADDILFIARSDIDS
jgi:hypothetical protein